MSEIRYDMLEENYVVIAPERLHRPDYMAWNKEEQQERSCPFCAGNEKLTPPEVFALRPGGERRDAAGWKTRVIPNLFKAVQIEAPWISRSEGIYCSWEGFGAHEIIIDTPRHITRIDAIAQEELFNWLKTMRQRRIDLKHDVRLVYLSLFKNHGPFAGATQPHLHTQLIALPVAPKPYVRLLERCYTHYRKAGRGLMEDMIDYEIKEEHRIVELNASFVAFCPFASGYPFEVMIAARKPFYSLETIPDDDMRLLAQLMQSVYTKMGIQLGDFDFNLTVMEPPLRKSFDTPQMDEHTQRMWRFSLRIIPRIYRHGGFELSTGMMINPVAPEESARLLREAQR